MSCVLCYRSTCRTTSFPSTSSVRAWSRSVARSTARPHGDPSSGFRSPASGRSTSSATSERGASASSTPRALSCAGHSKNHRAKWCAATRVNVFVVIRVNHRVVTRAKWCVVTRAKWCVVTRAKWCVVTSASQRVVFHVKWFVVNLCVVTRAKWFVVILVSQ